MPRFEGRPPLASCPDQGTSTSWSRLMIGRYQCLGWAGGQQRGRRLWCILGSSELFLPLARRAVQTASPLAVVAPASRRDSPE